MAKLTIATAKYDQALKSCAADEKPNLVLDLTKTTVVFEMSNLNKNFLRALLMTGPTAQQRALIQHMLGNQNGVMGEAVKTPSSFANLMEVFVKPEIPTLLHKIGSRWYPVCVTRSSYHAGYSGEEGAATIGIMYKICEMTITKDIYVTRSAFRDDRTKDPIVRTPLELLEERGYRPLSDEVFSEWQDASERAEALRERTGLVLDMHGTALVSNPMLWRSNLDEIRVGTSSVPSIGIVESELETEERNRHGRSESTATLPFIRAFSTDLKKYMYVDISDCVPHTFDVSAEDRLHLPPKMGNIIKKVFSSPEIFGDMFSGRHGGMVLLANGPTGVGKTLTAEVFAEMTKRPLYVLEMGELGTNLATVESSLQRVFARAARWNAVLLFDEADVFMAKRTDSDLERSAIVGVFLRLLDRYAGMFFLTSNRADVIDPAFAGRITLRLDYPKIDHTTRAKIWKDMLHAGGFEDFSLAFLSGIAELRDLNGREIRNQVRLLKVLHPDGKITAEDVKETLDLVPRKALSEV